ncbi:MAG TPA: hypothetical protein VIH88_14635 [Candidatus Acidoferrales bacterium]
MKKATLSEFIDENSKLITSLAAFVALTVFSSQIAKDQTGFGLPAASLLGAILISVELFYKTPPRLREWRLELFELVLLTLPVWMGWYWFSTYRNFWISVLVTFLPVILMFVVAGLLTHALDKAYQKAARLLKREVRPERSRHWSAIVFITFLCLLIYGSTWLAHRLAAHPLNVKIPWTK